MTAKKINKGWFFDNTFVTEAAMNNYVSFFAQGYQEHQEEVVCKILIKMLGKKFGDLSDKYCSRLKKLDWIQLEVLLDNIDSFEGIEAVDKYFCFDDEEN